VICDDTNDTINHVIYHYFQAVDRGKVYQMPPELTEEEELPVAVLIIQEEERRAELREFPELANALVQGRAGKIQGPVRTSKIGPILLKYKLQNK
jgi:hypothetical protein